MKRKKKCFIKSPPPTLLSASFGRDDSWQAPLIFSLTAHTVTKVLVVHRKWVLISIFRMTSHTQCISSRHWLCHVVPRVELLISLHYHYRSTRRIGGGGGGGGIKISHYLTFSLNIEDPSCHTCKMQWAARDHHMIRHFHHLRCFITASVVSLGNHQIVKENVIIRLINVVLYLVFL